MPLEVAAHLYVAHLAEQLAAEAWEQLMLDNATYGAVKGQEYKQKRNVFIRTVAPTLRQRARQILGEMLGRADVAEDEKHEIWEALTLDASLPKAGNSYPVN